MTHAYTGPQFSNGDVESALNRHSLEYSTLAELDLEPRAIQQSELTSEGNLNPPRTLTGPKSHIAWAALSDVYEQGGQLLVFVSTRRSSQSEAKKLGQRMHKHLAKLRLEQKIPFPKNLVQNTLFLPFLSPPSSSSSSACYSSYSPRKNTPSF